ncbi:serine/threonine-protein kinase [Polyangium sp. 6x1]|uniref:serine/threonine-protein kinase n=1 Tax=Polyangium sp. 6x1 TaxID=3042689 RepID=UPI002482EE4D|nr:serine/threonine-protein kinase [Polyangium sp. 6x1]MDI1448547.1 protein kinase [Polyangium sp. 6x1]
MRPGEVLGGRFRVEARVNAGGMGEILRAIDLATGHVVAAKILVAVSPESLERFRREAQILARLSHPGIVRYVAYDTSSASSPLLVMEWLEGEDLGRRLARGPLSLREAVTLGQRLAEALAVAHDAGVVHRDLKPQNVFLVNGSVGDPRILDFGIAHCGEASRITQTGTVIGTPSYMAPEQVRSGSIVKASADVFSLGCLIFECITGAPPFRADHTIAVLAKIIFEDAPRLSERAPSVPSWLDGLIARMLAKEPLGRPPDGAAVAIALAAEKDLDPPSSEAPRSSAPRSTLGEGERRFLGVVLRGRREGFGPFGPATTLACASPTDDLGAIAERFGGQLEVFADGTAAVVIDRTRVPTDVAAHVARCALALWERAPGAAMAVAAGFGERARGVPVGEAIDRAARLLHARSGDARIALDETTVGLLDARFDVEALEGGGFALLGERASFEVSRPLLGKPTPCVGREHELGLLDLTFGACKNEPAARVVVVSGLAGIGKSRLLHEFVERQRAAVEPAEIWFGRGDPLRVASSFGLLAEVLRGASGIRGGETLARRRELFFARVALRVPERDRRRVANFLGELAGVPFPDDDDLPLRAARQDPELCGEQMQRALRDFLRAECAAKPLVLLLEDVHWGDRASLLALDAALEGLAFEPILLCASARPEIDELFPGLWSSRGRQDVRLRHLSPRACVRLVRHALGELREGLEERLVASSEGHPFFLEELIRAEAEGRGGTPPGTVVAMVQSRLERLEPSARRTLRAASILGEVFWRGAVARLAGDDDEAATRDLAALVTHEIVTRQRESRIPGEPQYAFRQALWREGAYAMLTDEDRALGHYLAAEWLEEKGEADALVLAEHFERGGAAARAASFYLASAEQSAARKDYLDAERCYGKAEALWGELPTLAQRGRGLSRFRLGRYHDALTVLARAREAAARRGEASLVVELYLDEAMVLDWTGEYREAERRVQCARVEEQALASRSLLLEARVLLGVGRSAMRAEREEEAADELSRAAELASRLGDEGYETYMIAHLLLGYLLPLLGRVDEAAALLDEVIRRCEERGDLLHLGAAWNTRAMVRALRGDRDGMIRDFERTSELGRELGQPTMELAGHYNLAEHLYWMDDVEAAEPMIRAALGVAARRAGCVRPAMLALLDARIALVRGDARTARAIASALRGGAAEMSPSEDVLCAMIELATGDGEGSFSDVDAAWEALEARSARESVGQEHIEVLEARAMHASRLGHRERAMRQLDEAIAAASRIPNVMSERLRRRRDELACLGAA